MGVDIDEYSDVFKLSFGDGLNGLFESLLEEGAEGRRRGRLKKVVDLETDFDRTWLLSHEESHLYVLFTGACVCWDFRKTLGKFWINLSYLVRILKLLARS